MERGRIQRLPNFWGVPPTISGTGKATDFKFGGYIYRDKPNKSLLKILEKRAVGVVAVGVVRDSQKLSGQPCRPIGRIARSSLQ